MDLLHDGYATLHTIEDAMILTAAHTCYSLYRKALMRYVIYLLRAHEDSADPKWNGRREYDQSNTMPANDPYPNGFHITPGSQIDGMAGKMFLQCCTASCTAPS